MLGTDIRIRKVSSSRTSTHGASSAHVWRGAACPCRRTGVPGCIISVVRFVIGPVVLLIISIVIPRTSVIIGIALVLGIAAITVPVSAGLRPSVVIAAPVIAVAQ